jgi:fluoride ion exporter CrcB/FEX
VQAYLPIDTIFVNIGIYFLIEIILYGITHGKNIPPFIIDIVVYGFNEAYADLSSIAYNSFKFILTCII